MNSLRGSVGELWTKWPRVTAVAFAFLKMFQTFENIPLRFASALDCFSDSHKLKIYNYFCTSIRPTIIHTQV